MAEARRRLAEAGFSEAILWVLQGNDRARSFYEGEGWSPDGATPGRATSPFRRRRSLDQGTGMTQRTSPFVREGYPRPLPAP